MMNSKMQSFSIIVALSTGIAIGIALRPYEATAGSPAFQATGQLEVPGLDQDQKIFRAEDKETGIVCYYFPKGFAFSCATKK
jgi:hypothetical protein